MVSCVVAKTRR